MDSRTYGRYLAQVIVTALTIGVVLVIAAVAVWTVRTISGAC